MKFFWFWTSRHTTEERRKCAELVLKNPIFVEMTEPVRKMRFQLMAVSSIAIFSICRLSVI
jgi:hypothetical protein